MIKTLYEEGFLNIEKILIREFKKLHLEIQELSVLLCLFDSYEKKIFSSSFLATKANLSKNELESILERLRQKNFFSILQDKKDNKIIEIFNLDNTFVKIQQLYKEKKTKSTEKKQKNNISETIENLETLKGRLLTGNELEIVKSWYLEQNYTHDNITQIIVQAGLNKKDSLNYIERILSQKNHVKIENDDKADQILHKIFKQIKK
ncbi:MAG: DNA replication protein [Candidatus Phytoplasma pruni]|uniref:Chromosome replication initiation protein n=1 Tax=Poinsettia branch-inducing phytoplasma TaxID=138647 RepID=G3XGK1_9MOLU|nr:DnaD domain protein [Poinsettia branch-inducing phytoplasma]WEK82745.1 MAG: DNA replication protein [Candidatus Phytoplasma pruni]BAL03420.1 chromosome replication initiation protein [Poinsettia branch-inducing phytoplasma]BAL03423.1 chromosome replication initiation protein [Poinsettia branch-inducing phytoplasma]BAL03426.1 chromosome replication initiation protein [Poinsettia branch-inducing phytoplasma]BAL03429.1 chromosome replication initiation protein [Poinsettia branch-inducing phyto